jgi:hypothetical protein
MNPMKTYMNWFLSGGMVVSLLVITLLFSKLVALDGRLAVLEATLSGSSVTAAAGALSTPSNGLSAKTGKAHQGWGNADANHPFGSLGNKSDSPNSVEELLANMPTGFDIQDPRFQEKLADMVTQKQRQRDEVSRSSARDRWRDDMTEEVGSFVAQTGLEDMESDIIGVFDEVDAQRRDMLELVEEGGVSQTELRAEMRGIHQDMEEELQDMLGEEDYEQLMRSVPMGPRPMRR